MAKCGVNGPFDGLGASRLGPRTRTFTKPQHLKVFGSLHAQRGSVVAPKAPTNLDRLTGQARHVNAASRQRLNDAQRDLDRIVLTPELAEVEVDEVFGPMHLAHPAPDDRRPRTLHVGLTRRQVAHTQLLARDLPFMGAPAHRTTRPLTRNQIDESPCGHRALANPSRLGQRMSARWAVPPVPPKEAPVVSIHRFGFDDHTDLAVAAKRVLAPILTPDEGLIAVDQHPFSVDL